MSDQGKGGRGDGKSGGRGFKGNSGRPHTGRSGEGRPGGGRSGGGTGGGRPSGGPARIKPAAGGGDRPRFRPGEARPERRFDAEAPQRRFTPDGGRDERRPERRDDRPARPAPAATQRPLSGTSGASDLERIAKVMARAGLCSRREAEEWILGGRVSVNGRPIDSPALDVTPQAIILVDNKPLPARERTRLWLHHKPRGLVTTADDPEGRATVFDNLPPDLPRVISIGRLDINTEGLLLLTNDGGLARVLAHPTTGWLRRYRVRAHGHADLAALEALRDGITIDGIDYEPIIATLDRKQGDNLWLTMDLTEGKNREIKRVLEHLGLQVSRLIRVSFGPFQLGDMPPGGVEEIRSRTLQEQLGPRLTAEAEANFEAPVFRPGEDAAPVEEPRRKRYLSKEGFQERRRKATLGEDADVTIERGAVADRRGRTVKVERIKFKAPEPEPEPAFERPDRGPDGRGGARRDDRSPGRGRFDERGEDRRERPAPGRPQGNRPYGDRPPRAEGGRSERPQRSYGARTGEAAGGDDRRGRPQGNRPYGDRPPRAEGGRSERPQRSYGARTGEAAGGGDRRGRPQGNRPYGDRPPRAEGGRSERPQRSYGARAGDEGRSGEAGAGAGFKPRGAFRGKPREGGPAGSDRPRSGPPRSGPARSGPARSGPARSGPPRSGPSRGDRPGGDRAGGGKRPPRKPAR